MRKIFPLLALFLLGADSRRPQFVDAPGELTPFSCTFTALGNQTVACTTPTSTQHVYVRSLWMISNTGTGPTFNMRQSADSTCATGLTALLPTSVTVSTAGSNATIWAFEDPGFFTALGNTLCLTSSSNSNTLAITVAGFVGP